MIVIKCKTCGSTNVIKQDDKYVCQDCGAEYSAMDAMSLISDDAEAQPIKPNKSQAKIDELYSLARQARKEEDRVAAETYYEALLQKDPDGWEAPFYLAYYKVSNTCWNDCAENCKNYSLNFEHVFSLAKARCQDNESFIVITREIKEGTEYLANKIIGYAFDEYPAIATSDEVSERTFSAFTMLLVLAMTIDTFFKEGEMALESTELRKEAVQDYADLLKKTDTKVLSPSIFDAVFGTVITKIKEYDPSYVRPHIAGLTDNNTTTAPSQHYDLSSSTPSYSSSSSNSSSGCYVATAVYGSYDCPEVWTLRRFRDYTLAETWYGRAFIKTYYAISPTLVKWFGETKWFKKMWRGPLDRLVSRLHDKGVEDTPYCDEPQ